MKYPRPKYLDPAVPTGKVPVMFSDAVVDVPRFDTPITPLQNFERAITRKDPLWVPNTLTDYQTLMFQDLGIGAQIGADFHRKTTEDYDFTDWFGVPLTWVVSAGGATNTPDTHLLEDITEWEKVIKFPVLSNWDWKTKADAFMKNDYDPKKVLHIDLHNGCIQRLIAVLGGYTEGMFALSLEPEAVRAFFERLADHMIELVDLLCSLYPVNLMTIHDDWGTEKDTFFSPKMMEELVFEPTKRIISHVRGKGVHFMLHSCGNITRFIPYMIDMGAELLQIQRRAVDIPAMKIKYGGKIGFNTGMEGLEPGTALPKEELLQKIRNSVDIYGKSGGFTANLFERDPELLWDSVTELYAYSREFYDKEQGR
ncbi:Uroporphyrinogen decarboxylase (URO-D) [Sporobacter termitidis DSM 10068]|uniref:Uroporphyrinogen decarboxylase (URO-D) n=1 Tax=Sporobacter termitidis DSM 10068 TaxID=1123282 RepID=A0A1M5YLM5_9FIRM|nr:uroporphyrinogen decarboxylase family protein [Sporobacter termitidis]SHI12443.1 Uroporphyrinogen decarboxylase (URO-D) [Sporobacter termitidis DSM 10068]